MYTKSYPWGTKFGLFVLYDQPFSTCKVVENHNNDKFTHNDIRLTETLSSQNYTICIKYTYLPVRPKYLSFSLYDQPFLDSRLLKIRYIRNVLNDPELTLNT